VIRTVVGFHQETDGNWVAELSCWHKQHVRHQPPFQERAWVLDSKGRADRVGSPIDCSLCERAELPAGLAVLDRAGPWDEASIPDALRHTHRTPQGRWGNLQVREGTVNFQFRPEDTPPGPVLHLRAGSNQPIPPDLAHRVIPIGPVRLELEFWGHKPAQTPAGQLRSPTIA
jgi:tellurite methyltransferase